MKTLAALADVTERTLRNIKSGNFATYASTLRRVEKGLTKYEKRRTK